MPRSTSEKMQALGFSLVSEARDRQKWQSHDGKFSVSGRAGHHGRSWSAWRKLDNGKEEVLCAHGGMFFSGPTRKFGKPETAAKAALAEWRNYLS